MPRHETSHRHQTAVYWPAAGADDEGQPTVGDPVEIRVRWEAGRKETVDARGDPAALDAVVVLDRRVELGSRLWLGTLDSWTGTGSAGDDTEVMKVVTYSEIPDVRGRRMRRVAGLAFWKDTVS